MKTIFIAILTALLSTLNGQVVIIKNKTGPHGGVVNVEKGYKIEMLDSPVSVVVYLFDTDMEVVSNKNIQAEIMFVYANNVTLNKSMLACEKNGFIVDVGSQYYLYSVVTFNISGKMISSKFENLLGLAEKDKKSKTTRNE